MTAKGLTWAYIVLLIVGAAIGAYFLLRKPSYVISRSSAASPDSIAAYEQRIGGLSGKLDSLKTVLARRGLLRRAATRIRIAEVEQQLSQLRAAVQLWRDAHDDYGVGQAYRTCLLLYGSAQAACRSLSYDTLPPEADTLQPPR